MVRASSAWRPCLALIDPAEGFSTYQRQPARNAHHPEGRDEWRETPQRHHQAVQQPTDGGARERERQPERQARTSLKRTRKDDP